MNSEQAGSNAGQCQAMSAERVEERLAKGRRLYAQGHYEDANEALQEVVTLQPDCCAAWIELARLALTIPDFDAAKDFLTEAVTLEPASLEALCMLGGVLRRLGALEQALEYLQRAQGLASNNLVVGCQLANCYVDGGELTKAKDLLTSLLARCPGVAELYLLRGFVLHHLGHEEEAESDLQISLSLAPGNGQALAFLADVYRGRGQLQEASEFAKSAYQTAPHDIDVLRARGYVCLALGEWSLASDMLGAVLEREPNDIVAALNRAAALVESGQAQSAINALEAALRLGAGEPWVHEMLGYLFARREDWLIAAENLEASVHEDPKSISSWNALIVVYGKLGEMEKAEVAAKRVLAIDPVYVDALINLAGLKVDIGLHDEAIALFHRALAKDGSNIIAYSALLFGMLFSSQVRPEDILNTAIQCDERVWKSLRRSDSFSDRNRDTKRRLRIGWVSSDLRSHAVGAFVGPFVSYLSTDCYEHYVYDNWPAGDVITAQIRPFAKEWRGILGLGDNAVADLIRSDEIDILVDLNGFTAGHRLAVFARKPAPIQVEWLGYPGTTGMSSMDYIFVPNDDYLALGEWCSEKPWPLKDCYGVRGGIPDVPVRETLPCDESGLFTFACMNRFSKVSARALDLWGNLLQQVPNSRLLLIGRGGADEQTVSGLRKRFQEKGITADRLEILESKPPREYLDTYNRVDLCLDPFPFNGGTTGFDSIWMGVPYVTLRGDSLHSRAGSNILKYVGLEELVANSEVEYVEIAAGLASDRDLLRRHRSNLRERMRQSPLADVKAFAAGMENAFREMWQIWCAQGEAQ